MSLNPVPTSHYNCFLEPQITYFEINYFSLHVVLSLPMKITAMKITPSHKFIQLVKHTATTWPNLNLIPFPPWGQRLWSTWVFFKCVSFPSYATSRDKEKRMKSQTCWTNGPRPNLCFCLFPLTPPCGTRWTLPTQRPIGPRPIFHFPFTPPRGTEQKSPTYCPIGLRPIFSFLHHLVVHFVSLFSLFFYTTSWHRAEVPDTPLKRSPTDLCFLFLSFSYTTVRTQRILTEASRPTVLSRDKQEKKCANSINNFFDPQLAKEKTKNSSHGI